MKKSLLITASFFIGIVSMSAQITLSSLDMPIPTKIFFLANDTLPTVSVGTADTNEVWNMSALAQQTHDTSMAQTYSAAPNAIFSNANLVVYQSSTGLNGYVINNTSSMTILGGGGILNVLGTPTPVNQIDSPGEIAFKFPCSYDSSFTEHYRTKAKFHYGHTVSGFMVDSVQQITNVKKSFLVDAWGTLTTPLGGGPYHVLRTKETKISHDTTKAFVFGSWNVIPGGAGITADSVTTYNWWANGIGAPIATATMDSAGTAKNIQWLMSMPIAPPLSATTSVSSVSCSGLCDGTASATANWGTPPYTYSWSTSPVQHTHFASGLCAGTYTVTVTDSVHATTTATAIIHPPALPIITANGVILSTIFAATSFQWYKNDTLIAGSTTSNYTVTTNGNYTVVVSNGSCHDTSSVFIFHTIGISESVMDNSVSVYPNPVNNQITIQFMTSIKPNGSIEIKNELGQRVKTIGSKQMTINKNEMIVNVADLPNGVYFIQIQNQNNTINKKFIKQ